MSEAVGRRRPVLVGARDDRLLDPGEALGDVFAEEAGRSLLVLGEPGSGKSVLLRHLARELLERPGAEAEPIPVLLDLAGWTADGRLFIEWLASEDGLRRSYRSISDAQLRAWLHDGHLTLLLDGLDEVRAEQRAACVEAINAFIGGAGGGAPGGLVVCCRVDEYHVIAREVGPLDLGAAIYLQPLTEAQVGRYLDTAGPHAGGLRAAWEADEAVRELARNPLMLRTMSLAFGRSGGEAGHAAVGPGLRGEALRKHLLDAYVGRVFERAEVRVQRREDPDALPESGLPVPEGERVFEGDPAWASGAREALPFERAEVVRRLGWLAVRLREHARSTFYVEELQPSWLSVRQRGPYVMLSRGAGGVLLGLTAGALLLLGLGAGGTLFGIGEAAVTGGIVVALSLAGALLVSGHDALRFARGRPAPAGARALGLAASVAALGGLGSVLFWATDRRGAYGLLFGVVWSAVVVAVFDPAAAWRTVTRDVRLVEPLRWSWRSALRASRRGFVGGALVGAVLGGLIAGSRASGGPVSWGAVVVVTAGAAAVLAAVVGGALGGLVHGSVRAMPRHNLGLRLSVRNAAFAGAVTALAGTLVFVALGLGSGALGLGGAVRLGLSGGLFCGLLAALRYGGLNAVYHGTLRVLLARAGHLALGAAPFFRFVTDLSLVRSAGGGYAFAHRLFAAYFAEQAEAEGLDQREAEGRVGGVAEYVEGGVDGALGGEDA